MTEMKTTDTNTHSYKCIGVAKEGSLRDQDEKKDKASIDIKLNPLPLIKLTDILGFCRYLAILLAL